MKSEDRGRITHVISYIHYYTIKNMRTLRLLFTFYRSFAFFSFLITFSCLSILYTWGISTVVVLFWFKMVTEFLIFYYINNFRKEYYYYHKNLGLSKRKMWISTIILDVFVFYIDDINFKF